MIINLTKEQIKDVFGELRYMGADNCYKYDKESRKRTDEVEALKTEFIPIQHFYPHALRHTFATRCFEAGIEAKVVQGFLGHYSIAITLDLYTHVTNDKAKTEMDKLENLYQEII